MKKIIVILLLLSIGFFINAQENASCRDFTQVSVDTLVENEFLPDGRYNSVKLNQGDKIEIYKPFYKGKNYMVIISSEETLPGIIVEIKDITRNVIINALEPNNIQELNFMPDKNQNLIISVKVTESEELDETKQGCVSVVVGFKQ